MVGDEGPLEHLLAVNMRPLGWAASQGCAASAEAKNGMWLQISSASSKVMDVEARLLGPSSGESIAVTVPAGSTRR